jgi:hypothetical protein
LPFRAGFVDFGQLGGEGFKVYMVFFAEPVKGGGKAVMAI